MSRERNSMKLEFDNSSTTTTTKPIVVIPGPTVSQRLADMLSLMSPGRKPSNNPAKQSRRPDPSASPREAPASSGSVTSNLAKPTQAPSYTVKPMNLSDDGAATPSQTSTLPMTVFPALTRLLAAARDCQLPPSPTEPAPGSPNYPTVMLALSNTISPKMQRSSWCLADYAVVEKLYKGYASSVYRAFCRRSSETVVLKVYTLGAVCDLYKYQIYREVRLHSSMQHENIISMHAAFQEGDKVVMVEEYADGADLFNVMQRYGGRLSERLSIQLVLEPFLRVLNYLHSRGIIHRDIKPENIMFTRDMRLKLGDFGLAIDIQEERAVTRAGTLDYMAPEVLKCPFKSHPNENKDNELLHYSGPVDSWAVGVLTYELLSGTPPFYNKERTDTEKQIFTATPEIPKGITDEARDFIMTALSKNPLKRPTIHQMLHHPWIAGYRSRCSARQVAPLLGPAAAAAASPLAAAAAAAAAAAQGAATAREGPSQQSLGAAIAKKLLDKASMAPPRCYLENPPTLEEQQTWARPMPNPASPMLPLMPVAASKLAASPSPAQQAEESRAQSGGRKAAVEKLLMGSSSLQEYLQQQQLKVQQRKQQQQPAPAKQLHSNGPSSPTSLLSAALSQANSADGSVIMNVQSHTTKTPVVQEPLQQAAATIANF